MTICGYRRKEDSIEFLILLRVTIFSKECLALAHIIWGGRFINSGRTNLDTSLACSSWQFYTYNDRLSCAECSQIGGHISKQNSLEHSPTYLTYSANPKASSIWHESSNLIPACSMQFGHSGFLSVNLMYLLFPLPITLFS